MASSVICLRISSLLLEHDCRLRDGSQQDGNERNQGRCQPELWMPRRKEISMQKRRDETRCDHQPGKHFPERLLSDEAFVSMQQQNHQRKVEQEKELNPAGESEKLPFLPERRVNLVGDEHG